MANYTTPLRSATPWRDFFSACWSGIKRMPATFAALTCTGVGISYNAQFAQQFGTTAIALAIAADVLKAASGPMFMSAIRSGEWGRAGAAFLVGLVTLAFSLVAAFGSAQHVREENTDGRRDQIRAFDAAEKKLAEIRSEIAQLGKPRPREIVQGEKNLFKIDAELWRRSKKCTEASKPDTQAYCAPLLALDIELGARATLTALEGKGKDGQTIAELEQILAKGRPAHADPQSAAIAKKTGIDEDTIRLSISLLIVVAIEVGSIFGAIMATKPMGRRRDLEELEQKNLEQIRDRFFTDPPTPPMPPRPRRRRSQQERVVDRQAKVASFVNHYFEKHGEMPSASAVQEATGLPKTTAWRYQQKATA